MTSSSHLQKGALGRAVGLVWKQGESQSKQPTNEAFTAERQQEASGTALQDSSSAAEDAAHPHSTAVVLGTPSDIFHHRQAR